VTNQDKKAYLLRYRIADAEINDMLREKEHIMSRLTRMTTTISGMPHGGGESGKLTDGVGKLVELDREIDSRVDRLVELRREIEEHIAALDSDTQRRLLRLRYINGMTWERVAVEMGYERRQTNRIHGYALMSLNVT